MSGAFKSNLTFGARLIVGSVFIYASWDKIWHPHVFSADIEAYHILPKYMLYLAAIGIAWLEMICGVLMVTGVWTRAAAFLLSLLLSIFIIAIISGLLRGLDISCGCFESGTGEDRIGWPRVIEDGLLLAGAVWMVVYPSSPWALWDGEKLTNALSNQ